MNDEDAGAVAAQEQVSGQAGVAHTRGYATPSATNTGPDAGAYCVECSHLAQDYVWPCKVGDQ